MIIDNYFQEIEDKHSILLICHSIIKFDLTAKNPCLVIRLGAHKYYLDRKNVKLLILAIENYTYHTDCQFCHIGGCYMVEFKRTIRRLI